MKLLKLGDIERTFFKLGYSWIEFSIKLYILLYVKLKKY